jgi:hypothetical protein
MKKIDFLLLIVFLLIIASCSKNDNVVKEYYPNGYIKMEAEVKDGMRNGLTKNYDENGKLISTAELKNDKYEGWVITYSPYNGKVTAKSHYINDQQNGPVTLYYDGGQLYREMTYVDGRVDSIVKTFWPDISLQAEVYFKKGAPAIGLKEFDRQGKPIKQPNIVVEKIDQLSTQNYIVLKIYLSDHNPKVDFYYGELKDKKYLDPGTLKINSQDGVATMQYKVLKQHSLRENISIIARTRTKLGNTLVLQRNYYLNVTN